MKIAGPISILHVVFLSMTVIGLKNHVTILPPLLEAVGRDAWMSVILATAYTIPWLFLLLYIHKSSGSQSIKSMLEIGFGKWVSTIALYVISIFLLVMSAFTMRETLQWVKVTFLPETPIFLLLFVFTLLCILLVTTNLQTIAMVNVLVLFGVVVLGFFVAFVNIPVKDHELLRPFFEHGLEPIIKGSVYPASGFVELLLLLFLQHQFKDKIRWYHFAIMLFLLTGLTLGPLIGAITEFGPMEAAKQRYPAYEEWGIATLGRFLEHMDFFSIYQWLTGAFIRVGFLLFVAVSLLGLEKNKKRVWIAVAPAFLLVCFGLSFLSEPQFLELKGDYFLVATFIFFFLLAFFLAFAATRAKKRMKKIERKG